ncbi:MAG: DUF3857 domain-containing transglutaminase family protein [Chitinophagaceae bacterium]
MTVSNLLRWLPLMICTATIAQAPSMFSLTPSLTQSANSVMRLDEKQVTIKSLDKVIIDHHYILTVLNEAGSVFADLELQYDKFTRIEKIEGYLYDASGKKIRSLRKNDISDKPIFTQNDLAVDDRVKHHNFHHRVYPYTVEYEIRIEQQGTFFLPGWLPVWGASMAIENSRFVVTTPAGYSLRYKSFNYSGEPVISSTAKQTNYTWSLHAFAGLQREYRSPAWRQVTPGVLLGPDEFEIEDFKGRMGGWQEFGEFIGLLNKGLDVLPLQVKSEVKNIMGRTSNRKQLIDSLYSYLQRNTRYVSVQLGIGGWRPFPASYVAANGYGDCKALSNYMVALLKEAGIPAYYSLIRAGANEADVDERFPTVQFNHVIVCVPGDKDSTWLECTSQTNSTGYLSDFTSNRFTLLITPEGGKLVRTPVYTIHQNTQQRYITASLEADGRLQVNTITEYSGLQQDELHRMLSSLSRDRVKEYLQDKLDFATYEVKNFDYGEIRNQVPVVNEKLEMEILNYATITGKRLFINPNIMSRSDLRPLPDETRRFAVRLGEGYIDTDSAVINLPGNYTIESMPPVVKIDDEICTYSTEVRLDKNQLIYKRIMKYKGGDFPAIRYPDIVATLEKVYKADRNRVVLLKGN